MFTFTFPQSFTHCSPAVLWPYFVFYSHFFPGWLTHYSGFTHALSHVYLYFVECLLRFYSRCTHNILWVYSQLTSGFTHTLLQVLLKHYFRIYSNFTQDLLTHYFVFSSPSTPGLLTLYFKLTYTLLQIFLNFISDFTLTLYSGFTLTFLWIHQHFILCVPTPYSFFSHSWLQVHSVYSGFTHTLLQFYSQFTPCVPTLYTVFYL